MKSTWRNFVFTLFALLFPVADSASEVEVQSFDAVRSCLSYAPTFPDGTNCSINSRLFSVGSLLGKGSHANVFAAVAHVMDTKKRVALKIFMCSKAFKLELATLEMLSAAKVSHVPRLVDSSQNILVLERYSGDLKSFPVISQSLGLGNGEMFRVLISFLVQLSSALLDINEAGIAYVNCLKCTPSITVDVHDA